MKKLTAILATLLLSACAIPEQLSQQCSGDLQNVCKFAFGSRDSEQDEAAAEQIVDQNEVDNNQNIQIDTIEARLSDLEKLVNSNSVKIEQNRLAAEAGDLNAQAAINSANAQLGALIGAVAVLQKNIQVLEIVRPCPSSAAYSEVLLITNKGVIASFSDSASGANTRFTILTPGTYMTTQTSGNCVFKVNANNTISR